METLLDLGERTRRPHKNPEQSGVIEYSLQTHNFLARVPYSQSYGTPVSPRMNRTATGPPF